MPRGILHIDGYVASTDGQVTEVIPAQGENNTVYINAIVISNTSSTDTVVHLRSGGEVLMTLPAPANSGCTLALPIALRAVKENVNWEIQAGAAVSTVYVTLVGEVRNK